MTDELQKLCDGSESIGFDGRMFTMKEFTYMELKTILERIGESDLDSVAQFAGMEQYMQMFQMPQAVVTSPSQPLSEEVKEEVNMKSAVQEIPAT